MITARQIQRALMAERYQRNFVLPNHTPRDWFECDVLEVTAAGFFVEYEIKITMADLLADARKAKEGVWIKDTGNGNTGWKQAPEVTKHDRLKAGDVRGPSRFWFVLSPEINLPAGWGPLFAGIMVARMERGRVHFETIRPAPKLHREKLDAPRMDYARSICYWRMHRLLLAAKH